jgi:hypothetical protein
MSYDVAVWHADRVLTELEAQFVHDRLCDVDSYEEEVRDGEIAVLRADAAAAMPITPTPDVEDFYRALTRRYCELHLTPESRLDECPWAAALDRSDRHVGMCISFSFASDLVPVVGQIACAHGLDLYDPQDGKLYRARDPATIWPAPTPDDDPRVKRREAAKRLSEGLASTLGALGYAPIKGCDWFPVEFSRAIDDDIEARWSLMISSGSAEPYVSVLSTRVMEIFREVAPHPPRHWKQMRTYWGRLRREWFPHGVSREKSIEDSLQKLRISTPTLLPPAVAQLASLESLAALYNDEGREWSVMEDHVPFIATILARLTRGPDYERCVLLNRSRVAKHPPEWTKINAFYREGSPLEDYDRLLDLLEKI